MPSTEKKDGLLPKLKQIPPVQLIVLSFILLILLGTFLLSLPFSSKGEPVHVLDAAFTATSATCVTGLSLFDTFSTFTVFGQSVILLLIQIGGLGLATLATAVTLFLRRKLGFKNLMLFSEISGSSSFNLKDLLKAIMLITFTCELIGASILMIHFVPNYGLAGAWSSVFVAVSAFCNAGFDILGFIPGIGSLSAFNGVPLVTITVSALIFVGSLGFLVIQDIFVSKIYRRIKRQEKYKLKFHSQVCIIISLALLLLGTVGFFIFEFNNTLKDMPLGEKAIASLFQSVNTRTAGFYSVDIGAEHDITKFMTIFLMFIGGSPGSTAGGIKITTFIVLLSTISSTVRGRDEATFLSHRFDKKTVYKAVTVSVMGLGVVFIDLILLYFFNSGAGGSLDFLFESVSAFGTVGLTTGITPDLNVFGKLIIMVTMFIGRVGPASFAIAVILRPKKHGESILPEGRMLIG